MTASMLLLTLPLAASPLVYLGGRLGLRSGRRALPARLLALAVLGALWLLYADAPAAFAAGDVAFAPDAISRLVTFGVLALSTAATVFSMRYADGIPGEEKYYAALVAMTGAMIGLVHAGDLFNLWVWFELLTISSYSLVLFTRGRALEAGVKYLVQSAVGSTFVLLGIALVLMQAGTLDLAALARAAAPDPLLLAAGGMLVIGFGVKIALVPLHTWLPDAHSQAPSGISALLSGIVIEVALVALLRALAPMAGVSLSWGPLLMGLGAANMLAGNLLALRQTQVKRMLAYSSISHVGYMLLGFGIAIAAGDPAAAQGGFLHLIVHGFSKALAFLAVGALMFAFGSHALTVSELSGAARRYPGAALALVLALLSLSGLPPLAGFASKWQIFAAGFATRDVAVTLLVVFAAFNSLLSLAYYMPLVNVLYRQELSHGVSTGRAIPAAMLGPLIVLAVAILAIGLVPDLLTGLTAPAGQALAAAFAR